MRWLIARILCIFLWIINQTYTIKVHRHPILNYQLKFHPFCSLFSCIPHVKVEFLKFIIILFFFLFVQKKIRLTFINILNDVIKVLETFHRVIRKRFCCWLFCYTKHVFFTQLLGLWIFLTNHFLRSNKILLKYFKLRCS